LPSEILDLLAPQFDAIVESIYRAGSGLEPWLKPIAHVADVFDSWAVQLLGVNKATGVMAFSFEAGSAPPAAPVEYIRHYHRIDPRLAKALPQPPGTWIACEEHFDDAFVEKDPFYQDYLIPLGGRYLYGTKLRDDETMTVLLGHLGKSGRPPLGPDEKEAFRRLAEHFGRAMRIETALEQRTEQHSIGAELLSRMRQPMLLVDHQRRIAYRNRNGAEILKRGDLILEVDGRLACRDAESDHELTIALRDLVLVPVSNLGDAAKPLDRRSLRLRRRDNANVAATLLALRPDATLGSFGRTPQALFTLFEPGAALNIDPFLLSTTFDLTPAEARLAAMIVNGRSTEECARELNVKMSTVRSQLLSVFAKTGATGQADLVRQILSASSI
jgi:DNA-binding CsgD family transcriptional regulator